jgi:hypothetical protein
MGTLDDPAAADLDRCGHAPLGDLAKQAALGQHLADNLIVVAAVQVHGPRLREGAHPLQDAQGVQSCAQQGVVVAAGRCWHHANWDARGVGDHGAFAAVVAAVDRAAAGDLAAAAGALVMQLSMARSESSRPIMPS